MNFLEQQQDPRNGAWADGGSRPGQLLPHPRAPPLRALQRAATLDESRLYQKRIPPSAVANGSFRGSLSRKIIQRQNSTPNNFTLQPPPAPGSGVPDGSASASPHQLRRASTVVAAQKLLAAKKRKQELLERQNSIADKRSWSERAKSLAIVCVATLLILAGSCLLFISLLIVDPILVGLNAQFRTDPGICRTSRTKNATGPGNCEIPSCREGCTADLYGCTFIFVTYFESGDLNFTFVQRYYNHEIENWDPDETLAAFFPLAGANSTNNSYHYNNSTSQNLTATLMINPNGCGYPPEVNCSDFYDRFSEIGSLFPCFYSDSFFNEDFGVAVPFYDRSEEMMSLGLFGGISMASVILLFFLLLLLTKIKIRGNGPTSGDSEVDDMENQSDTRRRLTENPTTDDSIRLIDKVSSSRTEENEQRLDKMSERLNGHGPKKKLTLTNAPSISSIPLLIQSSTTEKTDMMTTTVQPNREVQRPSTSRNLP